MDTKQVIKYWEKSAENDFEVAKTLFRLKHYDHCLFFCHLVIEKLIEGLVVAKIKKHAPFSHDLIYLAKLADLELDPEKNKNLEEITKFNIRSRYDSIKLEFHKKCTKAYTEKYFDISKNMYLWLKKFYQKK